MYKKILLIICFIAAIITTITAQAQINMRITGVSGELLSNIQNRLKAVEPAPQATVSNRQLKQNIIKEIKAALSPYGYFKPSVHHQLTQVNGKWQDTFYVNPGPALRITHLDIQVTGKGANDVYFQHFLQKLPLAPGQVFSTPNYNQIKDKLYAIANSHGYFAAQMAQQEVRIDLIKYSCDISLHFNTGPQYRFGIVKFSHNPLSTAFLQRYVPFKTGEPYSAKKVAQLQQDLSNSNYFQQVLITPHTEQAENLHVPIAVALKPRKSRQYTLGLGYGTDTGVRALLGMELRYLTKTGQYFNTQLQASQIGSTLSANYVIPGQKPASERYMLSSAISQEDQVNGEGDLQKIGGSYIKAINGWQQSLALTLQREHYYLTGNPYQTVVLLVPSITWDKLITNNPLKSTRGTHINIYLLGATSAVIANTNFAQAQVSVKTMRSLSENSRLLLRGQIGFTAINDITQLPLSFQLFAGGSQSVRGYGYNTIGPGKDLEVGSAEFRYRIKGDWYAATFIDAGHVGSSFFQNFKKGAGAGIVWQSPVGTLELTATLALDYPGQPWSIQFSMGPDL